MSVVLGIDGGGTRTRASIVDGERGAGICGERIDQAAARGRCRRRKRICARC